MTLLTALLLFISGGLIQKSTANTAPVASLFFSTTSEIDKQPFTNWLLATVSSVVQKLNHHTTILSSMLIHHHEEIQEIRSTVSKVDERVSKVEKEVERVQQVTVKVEQEVDEARQRSMKGNLVVTSSTRGGMSSVFTKQEITDNNGRRMENDVEMVLRTVKNKTGVLFEPWEV